jgi:acyl-CoA reductase-like NAD-dependent aldehyde dehydrogenase
MIKTDLIYSINPATEEVVAMFEPFSPARIEAAIAGAARTFKGWRKTSFADRAAHLRAAGSFLRQDKTRLAGIITTEMGKPLAESQGEVEKCAWVCDYYAENAERFLRDDPRDSSASESYVQYMPLGPVLAVMPWNFPFWQVFRFAAPALMAGNTALLKHASNVTQCSLAIEQIFRDAGFPPGCFSSLVIPGSQVGDVIDDPRISAATLTGSEGAGSEVGARGGRALKKTVLELGGSDPFIVLEDADLDTAVEIGVKARYLNAGQSCIAAKRFILVDSAYAAFESRFAQRVAALKVGDPTDHSTQVGPLARSDLREVLEKQVRDSVERGARLLCGGTRRPGRGFFFNPAVLSGVSPDMPAACEEVFGPVAALIRARDCSEAIRIANNTPYGLGSSIWTTNLNRARRLARDIEAGQVFVNGAVASDPRLPFGGVKRSGYGRELSEYGIREFVNIQTVWIGPGTGR